MASVMAIVAKAVFEKQARGLGIGDVWPTDRYTSKAKALVTLGDGGSLFLVTVRPPEEPWLVGILESPTHDGNAWVASANITPIRAIGAQLGKLVLEHGGGLACEVGKLGMSLQSPRTLAAADVVLLRGAARPAPTRTTTSKPAKPPEPARVAPAPPASVRRVSVGTAAASLDEGNAREALAKLLALWKTSRSPAIANAIDALGAQLGETLVDDPRAIEKIAKRRPDDPRLATYVHEHLEQVAYTANSSRPVWDAFFAVLERVRDPRTASVIAKTRERWDKKLARRGAYHRAFLEAMDTVAAAAGRIPSSEVLEQDIAPFLSFGKRTPTADDRELARLYDQVYKHPDDEAARIVLLDALLEREDPRGELIRLQETAARGKLSTAERRREKQLIAEHGRRWLGALDDFVSKKDLVFERGFPVRLTIVKPAGKHPEFPVDAPETATVTSLAVGGSLDLRDAKTWVRAFRSVRRLQIPSFDQLEYLVADGPLPYEEIEYSNRRKAAWITRANFPNLRRIVSHWSDAITATTDRWFAEQQHAGRA